MATKRLESQYLTFHFGGNSLADIECDIEIEDDERWSTIFVNIKNEDVTSLQNQESVDIVITTSYIDETPYKETKINQAYIRDFQIAWGERLISTKFTLHPKEVYVIYKTPNITHKQRVSLKYYINKSPMLSPAISFNPDNNGWVKVKRNPPIKLKTGSRINFQSDIILSYQSRKGHFESDQHQIISTSFSKKKDVIDHIHQKITPYLDDIILLSSFLHKKKIQYSRWKAEFNGSTIFYFPSQKIKADDIEDNLFGELIAKKDIATFIDSVMPTYVDHPYKLSIKNAISSLMLNKETVIELTFLGYFQAFESMILTYKRIKGIEHIQPEESFKETRKNIEKTIKDTIKDNPELRGKIKSKLVELNRLSLKDAVNLFFSDFEVNTDGIWPLFDDKNNGVNGLSSIRNVLIHGDLIPSKKLKCVAIASEHLKILLIRCIFALLKWDVNRTKVSTDSLRKINFLFNDSVLIESINSMNEYFTKK